MNLSDAFALYLPLIEAEMRSILASSDAAVQRHYAMMQYHMGWLDVELQPTVAATGKRIRPLLCLLACAAAGGEPTNALPAAAGLELLHNFSLIHDDIEDNSPTRRHRPTLWRLFGMPLACNVGDGMFSLAHLAFQRLIEHNIAPATVLAALRIFDETCLALTEGQYLDMSFETRLDVTPAEYFRMIAGKTGALLTAAPQIGALVAGAPAEIQEAYRRFGAALGLAFQLQDDILGIWGNEEATGKSAASDILSKKKSLPVLYALEHPQVGPELAQRYAGPPFTPDDVPAILALLDTAGARQHVEAHVRLATADGLRALQEAEPFALPEPHQLLAELLTSLVGRTS